MAALVVVGWLGIRTLLAGNEKITIRFADSHDLKPNDTDIVYRGMSIGRVTGVDLDERGNSVVVTASIDNHAKKFLRTGTQFWLRGANPSLSNLSSLAALLSGPTIVMQPGPGTNTHDFLGQDHQPIAPADERPVVYRISFDGDVGSLKSGDTVKLHGFTVGEVRQIGFTYDVRTGQLAMPVTIALYPSLFHLPGELMGPIRQLVRQGLRARLDQDPPLVGAYRVTLEMQTGASAEAIRTVDGLPQLPTASGGGLSSIVDRVNKVPIEEIAKNILDATHRIDSLVASPRIKDAIAQLDGALQQMHQIASSAAPQVGPIIARLHKTADDLDATVKSAQRLVGGTATQDGLDATLGEVTNAARAVRSLANYLDQDPAALIRGRSDRSP